MTDQRFNIIRGTKGQKLEELVRLLPYNVTQVSSVKSPKTNAWEVHYVKPMR